MKINYCFPTLVLFLNLVIINTSAAQENQKANSFSLLNQEFDDYLVSVHYANDDFIIEKDINRLFGNTLFPSLDDHVTMSMASSLSLMRQSKQWSFDFHYHILTARKWNYRTDAIAFRFKFCDGNDIVRYGIGVGGIGNGNYFGSSIQNSYHRTFGYEEVTLRYDSFDQWGYLLNAEAHVYLSTYRYFTVISSITSMLSTARLPDNLTLSVTTRSNALWLSFETSIGYSARYNIHYPQFAIFGSGISYSALAEVPISERFSVAGWISDGQFGKTGGTQFGILLKWGNLQKVISNFNGVSFL